MLRNCRSLSFNPHSRWRHAVRLCGALTCPVPTLPTLPAHLLGGDRHESPEIQLWVLKPYPASLMGLGTVFSEKEERTLSILRLLWGWEFIIFVVTILEDILLSDLRMKLSLVITIIRHWLPSLAVNSGYHCYSCRSGGDQGSQLTQRWVDPRDEPGFWPQSLPGHLSPT